MTPSELIQAATEARAARKAEARTRYAAGEPASVLAADYGMAITTIRDWVVGARPPAVKPEGMASVVAKALAARSLLSLAWSTL